MLDPAKTFVFFFLVAMMVAACGADEGPEAAVDDPAVGLDEPGDPVGEPGVEPPVSEPVNPIADPPPVDEPEPQVGYYRDVKPILDRNCVRCHQPGAIRESLPLTTYEEAAPVAALIAQKVVDREMPPWLAGQDCTDYAWDESLSEEDIATVVAWVDEGAKAGSPELAVEAPPVAFSKLSREDLVLEMPVEYVPTAYPDDYRCFLLDWPLDEPEYVTGFRAIPGNGSIVHHVIAYVVPPGAVKTFEGYDAAEDGPGYTCFGSPGGGAGGFTEGVRWLGGWAPGGLGSDFPPDTGIHMAPGSKIALQVHYNVLNDAAGPDRSAIAVKLDKNVVKPAFILPWTNIYWVIMDTMNIPAGKKDVTHGFQFDPTQASILGLSGGPLTLYSATIHMHELGTSGYTYIKRKNGEEDCMLEIPRWDFGWQRNYGFQTPKVLEPGDQLGLRCWWDNSPANQKVVNGEQLDPVDVGWGDGTQDEMCLGVFYVTEGTP